MVNGRIGDTIREIGGNWERCQTAEPIPLNEFPARQFVLEDYARHPILPSYQWDGDERFLLNSFIRNKNYGHLYLYDGFQNMAREINPIERACCYGSAAFSLDSTHILLVFQDIRRAPENETQLYYIPIDQIGTGTAFTPCLCRACSSGMLMRIFSSPCTPPKQNNESRIRTERSTVKRRFQDNKAFIQSRPSTAGSTSHVSPCAQDGLTQ